jgi:diguanylate cyclase (GGDEF)-like protein
MMTLAQMSGVVTFALPRRSVVLRSCAQFLGLACLVFLVEEAMHHSGFFNHVWQAIWWPTNGLAVAFMVRSRRSRWPLILGGVLFGSLLGEIHYHSQSAANLINGIANAVGPLTAALALPRCRKLDDWLQEPHLVTRFVLFGLIGAPLFSAAIFATYMRAANPSLGFWNLLQIRADSDMLGYAMFTPLVLVLSSRDNYRRATKSDLLVSVMLLTLVATTSLAVFGQSSYALDFILVSAILLVSLRLGFTSSVLAVNVLAVVATAATMHGYGPLTLGGGSDIAHRILLLQAFLALSMITVFSVSVVQIEREVFQTQLEMAYRKMAKLASTDPLTGLGNRRLFEDTLKAEWTRARRSNTSVAVLMIDVDHFKSYNDRFGHPAGDLCLCAIAQAILAMGHRSSDLLARYGGEEFIFLMPETPLEDAARVAESMRILIGKLYDQPGSPLHCKVSISIGCAAFAPAPGLFPDLLISSADEALYLAKRNGRNRVEIAETPSRPFAIPTVS